MQTSQVQTFSVQNALQCLKPKLHYFDLSLTCWSTSRRMQQVLQHVVALLYSLLYFEFTTNWSKWRLVLTAVNRSLLLVWVIVTACDVYVSPGCNARLCYRPADHADTTDENIWQLTLSRCAWWIYIATWLRTNQPLGFRQLNYATPRNIVQPPRSLMLNKRGTRHAGIHIASLDIIVHNYLTPLAVVLFYT